MLVCKRWSKVIKERSKEYWRGESKTLPKAGLKAPRIDLGQDGYIARSTVQSTKRVQRSSR